MENNTKNKLNLFINNAQLVRKEFKLHNALTKRLAALLYAQENKQLDCEAIKQCLALIRQNTGIFSTFRGNMVLCIAALLSLLSNPQELFSETLKVYDMLKSTKLRASDYLAVAAFQVGMKSRHWFHTGQDDYIFSAMLGLSDIDTATGAERIEQLYSRLKGEFWDKNSVQALSQVLVLGGSCDETAGRILALRDLLKAQKIRLDKTYTLPALGILALLPIDSETIVRDISEARQILRGQKAFGAWSVSTQELLLFASAAVVNEYADSVRNGIVTAALSTSITNIIIAQQGAMIAAVSASSAAAASASSSS